jgi:hypothetical protein
MATQWEAYQGASPRQLTRRAFFPDRTPEMSVHDVKLFGNQVAASRLESRFARL